MTTTPDERALSWYIDSYEASRIAFQEQAHTLVPLRGGIQSGALPIPGEQGEDLSINWLHLPPSGSQEQLLIVSCGTHGIEAFAGCAVLRQLLTDVVPSLSLEHTGILALHAINPWGFSHHRRVTQHNVDLNRNASEDLALYENNNEGYHTIEKLLNPKRPARGRGLGFRLFPLKAVANIVRYGMPALRQAALQGQYDYPQGIYFGGNGPEPQRDALKPLLKEVAAPYRAVVMIDLHTGYGERGTLHLFPNAPRTPEIRTTTETLFAGYSIDWGDTEDFYTTTGDLVDWVGQVAATDKTFVPMVFEYGTLDSQTTGGSIDSIHRTILENQGVQYGYRTDHAERRIKYLYQEMFYPSSPQWRTKVIQDSDALWRAILPRVAQL